VDTGNGSLDSIKYECEDSRDNYVSCIQVAEDRAL
jgi:hypothetical protein